jgi:hypothetical protein
MMALVFMFMGVKVAASYDPVTEAAFKPFASLGESVGNFVAHSPSYLPLPHPAFAALTPAGMKGLSAKLDEIVREKDYALGKSATDLFDGELNTFKASVKDLGTTVDELNGNMQRVSVEALSRNPKEVA